jgi:hypothetical protein
MQRKLNLIENAVARIDAEEGLENALKIEEERISPKWNHLMSEFVKMNIEHY